MLMRPEYYENETKIIFRGRERDQHYGNENQNETE